MNDILGFDLNLLKSLQALLHSRSVSRAAKRMDVSQPAMSGTLRRLREALDDELLIRQGHRMIPTAFAETLLEPLDEALARIETTLFHQRRFDPEQWESTIVIITTDEVVELLGGPLSEALAEVAPKLTLVFTSLTADYGKDRLQRGDAHLAITVDWTAPAELKRVRLFDDRFVCMVASGHRFAERRPRASTFARASHLLVAPLGGTYGPVDVALADEGLERHISVVVPTFLGAASHLTRADLVCTLPRRAALAMSAHHPLALFEPPVSLAPLRYDLFWHPRFDRDPGHVWLRGLLHEVAQTL